MKHAAILYTCIGLMGAAAVAGFADYNDASKAGLLKNLYAEETATTGSTFIAQKNIEIADYSRAAIEEKFTNEELASNAAMKKPKRIKKVAPPPPPPPVTDTSFPAPPPPPEPPAPAANEVPPAPAVETTLETPVAPEVEANKELSFKIFSRAPLPTRKSHKRRRTQ
jgi:hypothetical protein